MKLTSYSMVNSGAHVHERARKVHTIGRRLGQKHSVLCFLVLVFKSLPFGATKCHDCALRHKTKWIYIP